MVAASGICSAKTEENPLLGQVLQCTTPAEFNCKREAGCAREDARWSQRK